MAQQHLTATIRFKTTHVPGTPGQLNEIARRYLEAKGVTFTSDNEIEI